ncbi:MAG TPA: DEAD/DEAH box helicase [Candidatus Saccharimonadales bacterium]|nr:DEAD/DEAH box helicase [Candidatus Saccharimonadales bacterium]
MSYNRNLGLRSPRSAHRTRSFGPKTHNNNRRNNSNRRPRGQYIDPAKFVRSAKTVEAEQYLPKHTFADFDIDPKIKANLSAKGYEIPSPIQDQTIPVGLAGKDVIGIANTGTGKTAAFAVPILNKLINDRNHRALIIAPTRELAQQIEDECRSIARGTGLSGTVLIGGTNMGGQLRDLRANPRVVIGTPGRIKDHIQRGSLKLDNFGMVVLDEVDRMLDMGFVHEVRDILSHLNPERQSFFFSATVDSKINGLIQTFSNDPTTIMVKTGQTSDNVNQDVVRYNSTSDKMDKLHDILNKRDVEKIIVFDETKRSVERLSKELVARGFLADAIHGGKTQGQRQRALKRFKNTEINILVATDVAARGIDVADITHVINYSTPQTYDDYVHRIGRAGRAGRVGHALTFVQ